MKKQNLSFDCTTYFLSPKNPNSCFSLALKNTYSAIKVSFCVVFISSFTNFSLAQCIGTSGNLLTNTSFESPVVGPGNNFFTWPLGAWQGSGPAGPNVVNPPPALGGPDFTHSGANYLEAVGGNTSIWQDVNIPCDATVFYSGYFSIRENVPASVKIDLYRVDSGPSLVYIGSSTTLNMDNTMNIWYLTNGSNAVVAGNYRFLVYLDDYANMDDVCLSYTCSSPLPIQLLDFEAKLSNQAVDLHWTTAAEIGNEFFTIEKSYDGKIWTLIAQMEGAGNSNSELNYDLVDDDLDLFQSVAYYKLTQIDFDGKKKEAPIQSVHLEGLDFFAVHPNPCADELNIVSINEHASVQLLDFAGNIVYEQILESKHSSLNVSFLESGVYFLKSEGKIIKIIKE